MQQCRIQIHSLAQKCRPLCQFGTCSLNTLVRWSRGSFHLCTCTPGLPRKGAGSGRALREERFEEQYKHSTMSCVYVHHVFENGSKGRDTRGNDTCTHQLRTRAVPGRTADGSHGLPFLCHVGWTLDHVLWTPFLDEFAFQFYNSGSKIIVGVH